METKWRSSLLSAAGKAGVYLTPEPLSLSEAVRVVESPQHGAVVTFSGTVRDKEGLGTISAIDYEAYAPMAQQELEKIKAEVERRWPVLLTIQHRTGRVPVGSASLIVAAASAHRCEAFESCEFVVNAIKQNVPIWKVGYEWN